MSDRGRGNTGAPSSDLNDDRARTESAPRRVGEVRQEREGGRRAANDRAGVAPVGADGNAPLVASAPVRGAFGHQLSPGRELAIHGATARALLDGTSGERHRCTP